MKALFTETQDRLLVEAAQRDPSHFAALYEKYFDRIYAYFAYRVGNREEAQDLSAEVFQEALIGLRRFEWRGAPFSAWLFGIAANVLADRWRDRVKHEVVSRDFDEDAGVSEEIELRAALYQLVDSLPPDQRRVIVGRFVEQKSIRDLAVELGRSEGAVKQLQVRALQTLRAQIRSKYV